MVPVPVSRSMPSPYASFRSALNRAEQGLRPVNRGAIDIDAVEDLETTSRLLRVVERPPMEAGYRRSVGEVHVVRVVCGYDGCIGGAAGASPVLVVVVEAVEHIANGLEA